MIGVVAFSGVVLTPAELLERAAQNARICDRGGCFLGEGNSGT